MDSRSTGSEQTILKGTLIIAVSSAIVKILSAVYKIPLYRIVGDSVMGYYQTGFQIYSVLLTFATAGLPVAMSRMVATANALERRNEPKRIFAVALFTYGLFSLLISAVMFFFSKEIAVLMQNPGADYAVKAIAPAVALVTVGAVIKGYYQGNQNMVPSSIANLIEAVVKLIAGFALAYIFLFFFPESPEKVAGGTIMCGAISGFAALSYLLILSVGKIRKRKKSGVFADQRCVPSMSYKYLTKSFFAISIPIMIGSLSTTLAGSVDNYLILGRFQDLGMTSSAANDLWGAYSSMPYTLYTLPTFVILAIATSIIPAVSSHFALGEKELIKKDIDLASRICGVVVFPIALGIAVLPEQILRFLFGESQYLADCASSMVFLCIAMIFLAFSNCFTGVLQAINKQHIPVINIVISLVVKTALAYILLGIPELSLNGAGISTAVSMMLLAILNSISLKKYTGMFPAVMPAIVKPLISAAVSSAAAWLSYKAFEGFFGENSGIALIASVAVAIVCYMFMAIITRTITKNDLKLLSKSNKK
ncbi:MAG: polysaccharide biosynthesis protein [Clostridia bacterium]|nr:polysaccharide biosynthesis protein [Clostridia bacterium]